jgi:hypothetical protein
MSTAATEAPTTAAPTLAERRTNLAEQRHDLAERREAREGGLAPAGGTGSGLTAKLGPLPAWAWLGIIAVGGAIVWFVYKGRQSSAAATPNASTTGNCIDNSGNSVPCNQVDYGGEIATLQTEIMDLQGESAPAPTSTPAATPAASGPAITGLHTTKVTSRNVSLAWNPVQGDFFYLVTYSTGTYPKSGFAVGTPTIVQAPSWTSPPLKSKTTYTFAVQAQGQGSTSLGPVSSISATTS